MKAHAYAAASVCSAFLPWLTKLDITVTWATRIIALIAAVLSILVSLRTLRKKGKK